MQLLKNLGKIFRISLLVIFFTAVMASSRIQAVEGDVTAPTFNFTQSVSGNFSWQVVTFLFSVTDNASTITLVTINIQYRDVNETYTVQPNDGGMDSTFEEFTSEAGATSLAGEDVPYIVTFEATDEEGNVGTQVFNITYTPDTVGPEIVFTVDPGEVDDANILFEGTVTDAETNVKGIGWELDGGERYNATIGDGGLEDELQEEFLINLTDLAEGAHTLVVFATDTHDNQTQESFTWDVDSTAPSCTSGFINLPSPHKSNVVTYTGISCTDNRDIISARFSVYHNSAGDVNNGDTSISPVDGAFDEATETFNVTYTLGEQYNLDGTTNMTFIVEDSVGNASYDYDPLVIEYTDATNPTLTVTPISPNPVVDPTLVLTGSCGDTDSLDTNSLISTLRYRIDDGIWQSIDSVDGALDEYAEDFSVALPELAVGTYDFDVSCIDATNHESTYAQSVGIEAPDDAAIPAIHTFSDTFTSHTYQEIANSDLVWGNGKLRLREDIGVSRESIDTTGYLTRYETNYTSFSVIKDAQDPTILWYVKKNKVFRYDTVAGTSSELLRSDFGFGGSYDTIGGIVSTVWDDNGVNKNLLWVGDAYNVYVFNLTDSEAVQISSLGGLGAIFPDLQRGRLGAYFGKPGDGDPGYTNLVYYDFNNTLTNTGDDQYAAAPTDVAGFTDDGFVSLILNADTNDIYASFLGEGIYKFNDQDTPLDFSDDEIVLHVTATDVFGGFILDPDGKLIYGTANNQQPHLYVVTNENGTPMDPSDDTINTLAEPIDLYYLNVTGLQYIQGENGVGDQILVTTESGSPVYFNFNDTYDDRVDDTFILLDVAGGIRPGAASALLTDYDTIYANIRNQGLYKVTLDRGWEDSGEAITIPARPSQKVVLDHFTAQATEDAALVASIPEPEIGGSGWLATLFSNIWPDDVVPTAYAAEPTVQYYMSNDDGTTWTEITLNELTSLAPRDYRVKFKIAMTEGDGTTSPVLEDYSLSFGGYPSQEESEGVASYTVLGSPSSISSGSNVTFTVNALDSLGFRISDFTGTVTATLLTSAGDAVSGISLNSINLTSGIGTLSTTQLANAGTFKIRVSDGTRTADSNVITVTSTTTSSPGPSPTPTPTPSTSSSSPSPTATPTPSPTVTTSATTSSSTTPQIYLYADKYTVEKGQQVTLTWMSEHLTSLNLSPGRGNVEDTGSFTTIINEETTFTLTGTGPDGELTSTVTIKLKGDPNEKLVLKVSDDMRVGTGEKVKIWWDATGADYVYIDYLGREAAHTGTFEFFPSQKTVITITAKKGAQEIKKQITIQVGATPITFVKGLVSKLPSLGVVQGVALLISIITAGLVGTIFNPFFSPIFEMIRRSLQSLGILPRRKMHGIVFNAKNGRPIPFARLLIHHLGAEESTESVSSDEYGVFHAFKLIPGEYRIEVIHSEFSFPTKATRLPLTSVFDFYKGEKFTIKDQHEELYFALPMDPLPQLSKTEKGHSFVGLAYSWARLVRHLFYPLMATSFVIAALYPTLYNLVIAAIYVVVMILAIHRRRLSPLLCGSVVDDTGKPVSGAVIRIMDSSLNSLYAMRMTNSQGKFNIHLSKHDYAIFCMKQGFVIDNKGEMSDLINLSHKESGDLKITLKPLPSSF